MDGYLYICGRKIKDDEPSIAGACASGMCCHGKWLSPADSVTLVGLPPLPEHWSMINLGPVLSAESLCLELVVPDEHKPTIDGTLEIEQVVVDTALF